MSNPIDSYFVRKRKLLNELAVENNNTDSNRYVTHYCVILSEAARVNPTHDNIVRFIEESGTSLANANTFIRECINLVNENSDRYSDLAQLVCDKVIPELDDFTLQDISEDAEMMQDLQIKNYVTDLLNKNIAADRVLKNFVTINEIFDLNEFFEGSERLNTNTVAYKFASVLNESTHIPDSAKLEIAIEETAYLKPSIDLFIFANEVYEYYCLANNPKSSERIKMRNVVSNSLFGDNLYIKEAEVYDDNITKAYKDFINGYNHTVESFKELEDKVFTDSDADTIRNNFCVFLEFMSRIIIASKNTDLIRYIIEKSIPSIKDRLVYKLSDEVDIKSILIAVKYQIELTLDKCEEKFNIFENNATDIYKFINALKMLKDQLETDIDVLYPKYNIECMTNIMNESSVEMTLREFKLFKFDNLISRLWKADRYLTKKFNQFKDKFKAKVAKVRSKIFENADIYEFLDIDGNIDYCISSFRYDPNIDLENLNECAIHYIFKLNSDIFKDSDYICYYEIAGDTIEFRVRSNKINISLNEEDVKTLNETISFEDMNRIKDITLTGTMLSTKFNLIDDAIRFFSKKENCNKFGTFLELCSLAGIDKEAINQIYYNTQVAHSDPKAFVITNSYYYDSYKPIEDNLVEVSYEAIIGIQALLEKSNDFSIAVKSLIPVNEKTLTRKWDEEDEDEDDEDDEDENDEDEDENKSVVEKNKEKSKDLNDKLAGTSNNSNNEDKNQKNNKPDKKGMSGLNKLKLYGHGLLQYAKTANNKIKTKIMNMNSSGDRLGRAIKSALISDRKEAIIKGSIIPSFHKCIAIAVGLAGLWTFNPPLAIISAVGGFAISKNLTKKERALMYDDVLIELKIVDKELQMAEDKNQIKKMRELMRIKKELERTAARIKYGSRIGKDIIPGGYSLRREED